MLCHGQSPSYSQEEVSHSLLISDHTSINIPQAALHVPHTQWGQACAQGEGNGEEPTTPWTKFGGKTFLKAALRRKAAAKH